MKGTCYIRDVLRDATLNRPEKAAEDGAFLLAALELLKEISSPSREEAFTKLATRELGRGDGRRERRAA